MKNLTLNLFLLNFNIITVNSTYQLFLFLGKRVPSHYLKQNMKDQGKLNNNFY